jgi:hypothetical protein
VAVEVAKWTFELSAPVGTRTAEVDKSLVKNGAVGIVLKAPGAVSPMQLGKSADVRVLGIGVTSIVLVPMP